MRKVKDTCNSEFLFEVVNVGLPKFPEPGAHDENIQLFRITLLLIITIFDKLKY